MSEPAVEAPVEENAPSIADHAAQFGPDAPAPAADTIPANETPAQKQEREQRRDKSTGQYQPGKTRHRARSQQASAEDVPRIQALTARAKAAEERAASLEAENAKYKAPTPAPQAQPAPVSRAVDDEPQDTDPAYADNYGKFLEDRARWAARDEFSKAQRQQYEHAQQQQRVNTFGQRMAAAQAKYPDFQAVALTPVPWQPGSLVDKFIWEDDNGPDILYHLQSHSDERDALGRMTTELAAWKFLSLLSQRLASPNPSAADPNGAAPRAIVNLPPRPPTPLRTEAQSGSTAAPPMDGSLSIAEHAKRFGRR